MNGTTSAGKSSLALALQRRLPGLWLRLGIDEALGWTAPGWSNRPEGFQVVRQPDGSAPIHLGAEGWAHARAWRAMARAAVEAGAGLILDDVMFEPRLIALWREALAGCDVLTVGVRCDLDVAMRREAARGDRVVGQARAQHPVVHQGMAYDVEVDTGALSTDQAADVVLAAMTAPRRAFAALCAAAERA